jgi:protein-tyrosine phosphatase
VAKQPIEHSYWVIPGRFLAGEYPRGLDELASEAKIEALIDAGVTAFIDLTEQDEGLRPYTYLLEPYKSSGVTHQRFPISDFKTPRSPAFTRAILDAIDRHLGEGRTVYLHCWGGVGRTGTIVGCWLARHGHRGEAALAKLHELWKQNPKSTARRSPETKEQETYILEWNERSSMDRGA